MLQAHVFSGIPADEAAVRRLLRLEITELLRLCLIRIENKAYSPRRIVEAFASQYETSLELRRSLSVQVQAEDFDRLSSWAVHLLGKRLHPIILINALTSRCFLEFDAVTGQFAESPVYHALYALQEEIWSFNEANTPENLNVIFSHAPKTRPAETRVLTLETTKIAILLHLLDRWVNIIAISVALAKHLDGAPFAMPALGPRSPFRGMDAELTREEPTVDHINEYVRHES